MSSRSGEACCELLYPVTYLLYSYMRSMYIVQVEAVVAAAEPFRACEPLVNVAELVNKIAIVERGDCMFVDKVTY